MAVELAALSIGARAARLLCQRTDWTVAATFERSFYINSGNAFVCVGDSSIGDGPLNVLVPASTCALVPNTIPLPAFPGEPARSRSDAKTANSARDPGPQPEGEWCIVIAASVEFTLRWSADAIWQTPPWPIATSDALANDRSRALIAAATMAAPPESFLHRIGAEEPTDPLGRKAQVAIARFRAVVRNPIAQACDAAVTSLAGLGSGLTPSGDDMLAGAVLMFHALGRTDRASNLAEAIRRIAPSRTSPLSFALLEPACDGEPNAAAHRAIVALLSGAPPVEVIEPLRSMGATSGFDILAGMLVATGA